MNNDFLTLEEAKTFSGKSESTLRRLIRKRVSSKKNPEHIRTRKLKNGGYQYLIHKDLLRKKYNIPLEMETEFEAETLKVSSPSTRSVENTNEAENENSALVTVLKQYLGTLEDQLKAKDNQISEKDKQLNELIERNREHQALLDKINEALIRFKIPEYIDAQMIPFDTNTDEPDGFSKSENESAKPKDMDDTIDQSIIDGKGTFSDWLKNLKSGDNNG